MQLRAIQFDIAWEDPSENLRRVGALLHEDPPPPQSLLVLPEMFATGFSMNPAKTAEASDGPAHRFVAEQARRYSCWVLAGLARRGDADQYSNDAVLFDPRGELAAKYSKRHLFSVAGENAHYEAGTRCVRHRVAEVEMSMHICYDLRFPEDFREASASGALLHVVIANWPAARHEHWKVLLAARAIENQAFVLGVNRCGADPGNAYAGGTRLLSPRGELLAALESAPGCLAATLDPEDVRAYRRDFPVFADRADVRRNLQE